MGVLRCIWQCLDIHHPLGSGYFFKVVFVGRSNQLDGVVAPTGRCQFDGVVEDT